MLGDEDVVAVFRRKHLAGVEFHAKRGGMGPEIEHRRRELGAGVAERVDRIQYVALVTIRIAEMLAEPRDAVELVARGIVAEPIAGILGEPQLAGARIDVTADTVANAQRDDLADAGLRFEATILRRA